MVPSSSPACLIIGIDSPVGAYLARLLDARGVALAGVGAPGLVTKLGIVAAITPVSTADIAAAAGEARLVLAISDGNAAAADRLAVALDAGKTTARLVHVADVAALGSAPVRDSIARITAARQAGGEAANLLLEAHDSRFGAATALTAQIIGIAHAAAQSGDDGAGAAHQVREIAETGPRDWGWTPEYVDAVQRLATREQLVDMVIASGHTLTADEVAHAAFAYFRRDAAAHLRITGTGTTVPVFDPAALKAATGWRASTWGADLVKALCEGAEDRS